MASYRQRSTRRNKTVGTITFNNISQYMLWTYEIVGQLSDGMWENTVPNDHWHFWCDLEPVLNLRATDAECIVKVTTLSWYCRKMGYNLVGLLEYVGERMMKTGRMGIALKQRGLFPISHELRYACEDMPDTFEDFKNHNWSKYADDSGHMNLISNELAEAFYGVKYTDDGLKKDLRRIKQIMKTHVV